jgi:fibronectin type 3 domain-containing protein
MQTLKRHKKSYRIYSTDTYRERYKVLLHNYNTYVHEPREDPG